MRGVSSIYRYDRIALCTALLAELPGVALLLVLKTMSIVFALPFYLLSIGRRRCVKKLYRYLAFPVL